MYASFVMQLVAYIDCFIKDPFISFHLSWLGLNDGTRLLGAIMICLVGKMIVGFKKWSYSN